MVRAITNVCLYFISAYYILKFRRCPLILTNLLMTMLTKSYVSLGGYVIKERSFNANFFGDIGCALVIASAINPTHSHSFDSHFKLMALV